MKKVLIVIHDLRIGGAQKSLVSFLHAISGQKPQKYDISVLAIDPVGEYVAQLPEKVRLLEPSGPLRWLGSSFNWRLVGKHFSVGGLWGELCWLVQKKRKKFPKGLNLQQKLWHSWQNRIPKDDAHYDVAVAYMDGVPGYYVMDKVQADKKVLWVHSQYQKQGYAPAFDRPFYQSADGIITISDVCKDCICQEFPEFSNKIHILENITDPETVVKKSLEDTAPEFTGCSKLKLLTVARLNPQKGVDLAISAAKLLQDATVPFLWLVAGDGPERQRLQAQISSLGLADCVQLLGSRENPYPYMRTCDILVQPSRVEGKSIVADEAKLLCKPIVATNYATVTDNLQHGETGWIVEMSPEGIASGIEKLWQEESLRSTLISHLKALPKGNREQLKEYLEYML